MAFKFFDESILVHHGSVISKYSEKCRGPATIYCGRTQSLIGGGSDPISKKEGFNEQTPKLRLRS
jgi:hypothetical protein